MKIHSNLVNTALFVIVLVLVLSGWRPQPATPAKAAFQDPASCDTSRSVQVSGAAVVYTMPDRALIQLGVQSNGTTPDITQSNNFLQVQAVIAAIKTLGVQAKDIATDYNLVYPVYENYDVLQIRGYRIDNTLSVTLNDVNLADDVLLAALKAGANEVQDVQFYTSELRKFRDQARQLAIGAAREKAQALATTAGAETGCVMSINENSWYSYYGSWRGGRQTALWAQNVYQNAAPSNSGSEGQSDDSPISLGQIAVRAEVNVSYSLK